MFIGKWNKSVILTYIGIFFGIIGMYLSINKYFNYAIICLIVSGICDLFDGTIARKCKRTSEEKDFGIQLDSLADIVNFGVSPIVLFISYGYDNWYDIIIYTIYIICQIARLAYFNITTKEGKVNFYYGLPVTFSALIFPLVYLLTYTNINKFHVIICATIIITSILNIINIKIKKPKGKTYIIFCILAISVISILLIK